MNEPGNQPTECRHTVLGVDLVNIARIQKAVERRGERFLRRCFTPAELFECQSRAELLAALFAGKEAAYKALSPDPGSGIGWLDFEILSSQSGKPQLSLTGAALAVAKHHGWLQTSVSLSQETGMAVALVTATCQARVHK